MRVALLAALVALTACSSNAEEAEERYAIVAENGSLQDKCDAAAEVADAYLAEKNAAKYQEWKDTSDLYCLATRYSP